MHCPAALHLQKDAWGLLFISCSHLGISKILSLFSSEISAPVRKPNKGEAAESYRGFTEVWNGHPGRRK